MQFFDLHCDTLYRCVKEGGSLFDNDFQLAFGRNTGFEKWVQCLAIWIPDTLRGKSALEFYKTAVLKLKQDMKSPVIDAGISCCSDGFCFDKKVNAVLTVEGGAVLGGDLNNIRIMKDDGVAAITLTWNGECEIGGGADTDIGITSFGKEAVKEMQKNKIAIDVSHACDRLFYDVMRITSAPIVATHSNSRKICPHRRNLTDEQFKLIRDTGGVVGLNLCRDFLSSKNRVTSEDIIRHAEHFLNLGGENTLCFGTDFDGADMPDDITDIEKISDLYNSFIEKGYEKDILSKIFYENAHNFFQGFDKSSVL